LNDDHDKQVKAGSRWLSLKNMKSQQECKNEVKHAIS